MKYVVVRYSGALPYFLCAPWSDGTDRWNCRLAQALRFDGPTARGIRDMLNAKTPAAVVPVTVETIK